MIKLQAGSTGYFKIDDTIKQISKGNYHVDYKNKEYNSSGDLDLNKLQIGLLSGDANERRIVIPYTHFIDWNNSGGVAYASLATLLTDINTICISTGGGGGAGDASAANQVLQTVELQAIKENQTNGNQLVTFPKQRLRSMITSVSGATEPYLKSLYVIASDDFIGTFNSLPFMAGEKISVTDISEPIPYTITAGTLTIHYQLAGIDYNFDVTANWATGDASYPVTNQASFELFLSERSYNETNNLTDIVITDFNLVGNRLRCNLSANGSNLDLSAISVTEVKSIGDIAGLLELYLNENQLTVFNPTLPLPSSLVRLNLTANQLTVFNPTLPLPSSLEGLSLDFNQLTAFNPTIPFPSSLISLALSGNQLTVFNPTLPLPSSLEGLHLGGNQLTTFNPTLPLPSSLEELNLTNNQLTTFNPTLPLPSSLERLYLLDNQLTTASYTAMEAWATAQPSFTNVCEVHFTGNMNSVAGTNLETILISKNCNVIA